MNLQIMNYGHYRVTSHGGRRYDLFNRRDDLVYSITKEEYEFIMGHNTEVADPENRCIRVEHDQLRAVEFKL